MLQDWVPARTSLAAGIVVKQHVLERNKYPLPQANITSSIAFVGSGSTNIPYLTENILVTGSSVQMGYIEGGEGGSIRNSEVLIYPSDRILDYYVSASNLPFGEFARNAEYPLTNYIEVSDNLGYFDNTTGIYTAKSDFTVPITFIISSSVTTSGALSGYDYINLYTNTGTGNILVAVGTSSFELNPTLNINNSPLNFSYTTIPLKNQTFNLTFDPRVDSSLALQLKVTQSAIPTTSSIFTIIDGNSLTFNLGLTGAVRIVSDISSSAGFGSAIIKFYNGSSISDELIYTTSSTSLNYTLNETFNITSGYLTIENDSAVKDIIFSNFVIYSEPDYYTVNVTPVGDFEQLITNEFDYNGELEGTNLVATDGDLNGTNTFLNYPKTPTNYVPVLYNSDTVSSGDFLLNTTIPGQGEIYLFYDTGSILSPFDDSSNL
jgi:hypothetical protein